MRMKKLPISLVIFLITATAFISYQITYNQVQKKYSEKEYAIMSVESAFAKVNLIDDNVRKHYIGDINEQTLEEGLVHGYLLGLGDKYATYMTKEEYDEYAQKNSDRAFGIGITAIYDNTRNGMYVTSVAKNSPAMLAGVRAGDIIILVDGQSVSERGYYNTLTYIGTGAKGSKVSLTVEKGPHHHEQIDYEIARDEVKAYTVESEMFKNSVAYVKITGFNAETPKDFSDTMKNLAQAGAVGYIFDVRNNPGGNLDSVVKVLDYLLPEGTILTKISKDGTETLYTSLSSSVEAPMAVIVNENTASGGEVFAAVLRDYDKTKLVGTTTYGKTMVQNLMMLPDGSALYLSTDKYILPKTTDYEGVGLSPDVRVSLTDEQISNIYMPAIGEDPQVLAAYDTLGIPDKEPQITINTAEDVEEEGSKQQS